MLRSVYRHFRRVLQVAAVLVIVLFAAVVTLGRIYMPHLGDYQSEILEQISERLDLQFEFSSLKGEWRGLSPIVTLKGAKLQNQAAQTVFEADHVEVSLDLLKTLILQRAVARTVSVVKPRLLLSRSEVGSWGLHGVQLGEGASPASVVLSRFLASINVLELSQVTAFSVADGQRALLIDNASLVLRQGLYLSQLSVELYQGAGQRGLFGEPALRLHGEFVGGLLDAAMVRGYLSLEAVQLASLSPMLSRWGGSLPQRLSGELWFDWQVGEHWEVQGTIRSDQWLVSEWVGRDVLPLAALSVGFLAQGDVSMPLAGRFENLQARWGSVDYHVAGGNFSISPEREHLALSLTSIDIESVVQGLRHNALLPAALLDVLADLQPRGGLHELHMQLPLERKVLGDFSLLARAQGVEFSSWQAVPAVAAIDGVLSMTLDRGTFDLDGSALELSFPRILSHKLPFEQLAGRVSWQLQDGLEVSSSLLRGEGDFGVASAVFDLDIPLPRRAEQPPLLTLQVGVQQSHVDFIDRFTPHLLPVGLRDWLRQSIRGGEVPQVGFIYHGSLRKLQPLAKSVQLFADVSDGQLRYQPQWPALQHIDASLVLSDGLLLATAGQATMLGSQLSDVRVKIEADSGHQRLSVASAVQGPAEDLITLFTASPLAEATGGAFRAWQARGAYSATLDLGMPLLAASSPELKIDGRLRGVDIEHPASGITFAKTSGALSYDHQRGLQARVLRARLWDQPMRATIGFGPTDARGVRPLRVEALAPVAVSSLRDWLAIPAFALGAGHSDWYATLDLFPLSSGQPSSLELRSNLEGVALNLPRPFAKTAEQLRTVDLQLELGADARPGELRYANLVKATFDTNQYPPRVGVGLGGSQSPSLPEQGVLISGQLYKAVLQEWLDTFNRYRRLSRGASVATRLLPPLALDQLRISELDIFGQVLRRPVIDIAMVDRRWQLALQHPRISGRLRVPLGDEPYYFDVDQLRLPLDDLRVSSEIAAGTSPLLAVDPGSIPRSRVHIGDLQLGGQALGRWSFVTAPQANTLEVSDINIALGKASFSALDSHSSGARLTWSKEGDSHSTTLQGRLQTGNLDQLLQHFGYDSGIVSESASVAINFQWDAPPDRLAMPMIAGDMALKLKHGQLLQTSGTGAEALRLLGILNVNYLARRLRLDFSDLYKAGLSYDRIGGTVQLDKGRVHLQEPLVVEGPSSQLTLRGDFDLLSETIDAELVVSLPLTNNLPWMVALTLPGGIPIAAGVYVAGRVFEKQLESLTSAVYRISGSLDNPEVKFKHLADPGEGQSNATSRGRRDRSGARR
jgi:uncharacterized protein (TIGR02099 family)